MILTSTGEGLDATRLAVPYDDSDLMRAFETRRVSHRDFMLRSFFRR